MARTSRYPQDLRDRVVRLVLDAGLLSHVQSCIPRLPLCSTKGGASELR
jgi:hypothetical protein